MTQDREDLGSNTTAGNYTFFLAVHEEKESNGAKNGPSCAAKENYKPSAEIAV